MYFKSLAGALGALLLFVLPTFAQTAVGRARGSWDLPTASHGGEVHGVLYNLSGRQFAMGARLTAMPLDGGRRGGRMDGVLARPDDTGMLRPVAEVHGTYVVGLDRRGRFEAVIVPLTSDETRPEPIGKIAGVFADPMIDRQDPVGRFIGSWAIAR